MAQTDTSPESASFNGELQQYQYKDITLSFSSSSVAAKQTRTMMRTVANHSIVQDDKARITKSSLPRKKRPSTKYAPPSKYAHLKPLTDIMEPNLICVFVGFNPGVQTATSGHAYGHPSNFFKKLLHRSGCTGCQLKPEEDSEASRFFTASSRDGVSDPKKIRYTVVKPGNRWEKKEQNGFIGMLADILGWEKQANRAMAKDMQWQNLCF